MSTDIKYHLQRARTERDSAYRSQEPRASDAHLRLSELHLQRALLLQDVRREPRGNVVPFGSSSNVMPKSNRAAGPRVLAEQSAPR
jgi:hypothetical protein